VRTQLQLQFQLQLQSQLQKGSNIIGLLYGIFLIRFLFFKAPLSNANAKCKMQMQMQAQIQMQAQFQAQAKAIFSTFSTQNSTNELTIMLPLSIH
jgi:hypothetical protein